MERHSITRIALLQRTVQRVPIRDILVKHWDKLFGVAPVLCHFEYTGDFPVEPGQIALGIAPLPRSLLCRPLTLDPVGFHRLRDDIRRQ